MLYTYVVVYMHLTYEYIHNRLKVIRLLVKYKIVHKTNKNEHKYQYLNYYCNLYRYRVPISYRFLYTELFLKNLRKVCHFLSQNCFNLISTL